MVMLTTGNILKRVHFGEHNNVIAYSDLKDFDCSVRSVDALGIKYVIKGQENYFIDGKHFPVNENQYLLVNVDQDFQAVIDKSRAVGYCININKAVLSSVNYAK